MQNIIVHIYTMLLEYMSADWVSEIYLAVKWIPGLENTSEGFNST